MILYKYLFYRFITGLSVSLLVLVSIEIFFSFTAELKYLNVGNYGMVSIIKYTILTIPKSIFIMFPYAVLIGAMLSLGAMASDMEFISMHAAGVSISKIIMIIMLQAFLLAAIFYAASDNFVPKFTKLAESKKNIALNKKLIFNHNGVWFKDKNTFIKINEIYSINNLKGITLYKYDSNNSLLSIKTIRDANYDNNQWNLIGIEEIFFDTNPVTKKYSDKEVVTTFIDQRLIGIKTNKSESLSLRDVVRNIRYLKNNNLDADIQKKIFWEKLFKPFSTVIMLFLSMPFIFGRNRSSNMSKRIVLGLFIGIIFFIITSILPNLGMVFGIMPFLNVLFPHIIFIILGFYMLNYQLDAGLR
jgi:lipopolysaccharide export system permease protein